jgi:ribosomal protein S18 acetylase RimI-like enzyme
MQIEPLTEARIDEAAAFCARHQLAAIAGNPWVEAPPLEVAARAVAQALRSSPNPSSETGTPLGFVALDGAHLCAVLAGTLYHFSPEDPPFGYLPPQMGALPLVKRAAASLEVAAECYPLLLAAWRTAALADGVQRLALSLPVSAWPEGAIWRRLGLQPNKIMGAQITAGWQAQPGRSVAGLSIRAATPDDLEAITDLALMEHLFHAQLPNLGISPEQPRETTRKVIAASLGSSKTQYMLAEYAASPGEPARPVGFMSGFVFVLAAEQVPRLYLPPWYGYLSIGSVDTEVRGQGVGRALFNALMPWFIEQGVPAVFLHYVTSNPLASRFWPRMGFAPYIEELA